MAFHASNIIPQVAYRRAKEVAYTLMLRAQGYSAAYANAVPRDQIVRMRDEFYGLLDQLTSFTTVPGIAAYAKAQESDSNYDVAAEFTALIAAVQDVLNHVESVFPTDVDGFLAERKFTVGGGTTVGTFTPAQLAGLKTRMDMLASAVD